MADTILKQLGAYVGTAIKQVKDELVSNLDSKKDKTTFVTATSDYTAAGGEFIYADTSAAVVTITLPDTPDTNTIIGIIDNTSSFGTNSLTIGRNGNTIMGLDEDMTVSTDNASIKLVYNGNNDWRIL